MDKEQHIPVLLKESIFGIVTNKDGLYIDSTFGRGGHSFALLSQLTTNGRVIAIDKDLSAIAYGQTQMADDARLTLCHGSFLDEFRRLIAQGYQGSVAGILLDLGISSPQLTESARGFSFMADGPLDMRMNQSQSQSAADYLAHVREDELIAVLRDYGEERFAKQIARSIVSERAIRPILRTSQLVALIEAAIPFREKHKHPATRTFQALRIFVNHELEELEQALPLALELLGKKGRLAVISFHSLEDRITKRFLQSLTRDTRPKWLPVTKESWQPCIRIIGKAIKPTEEEITHNPRSRSAILRIAEKIS